MSAILHQALLSSYPVAGGGGDPSFSSVVLLLKFNGTNGSSVFTDSSSFSKTISVVGSVTNSNLQSQFDGSSGFFNGGRLIPSGNSDFAFGSADFTVEFFARFDLTTGTRGLFDCRPTGGGQDLGIFMNSGRIQVLKDGAQRLLTGFIINVNTWYHIALSKNSGMTRLFVNGLNQGSFADSFTYGCPAGRPFLGQFGFDPGNGSFFGFMDELRVTNGAGRYTANFTPPSAPFPTS